MCPVMLYGSETWPVKENDIARLHVCLKERKLSKELLGRFNVLPSRYATESPTMVWECLMKEDNWVKKCRVMEILGKRERGRPKKTWEQVIVMDLRKLGITRSMAHGRLTWRQKIHGEQFNQC